MIFLLHGKARSGKDTVADYLIDAIGLRKLSLAKPLKKMGMDYFDLTHDECHNHKTDISRRILQGLGEMYRQEGGESFWTERVIKEIEDQYDFNAGIKHFAITDCRYVNDILDFKNHFQGEKIWENTNVPFLHCVSIKIIRGDCPEIEYGASHPTENGLNNFDFDVTIENNGTLHDLYDKVDNLLETQPI